VDSPNWHEVNLAGGSLDELKAVYYDLVSRWGGSAVDRFFAWEATKEVWRMRRQGVDADITRQIDALPSRVEARAHDWSETEHRARVRKQGEATIGTLRRVHESLKRGEEKAQVTPRLEIVG